MCRIIFLTAVFAALALSATAALSFNTRLEKGNALLKSGNVDGALTQYRDLQTEDPESPVLYYNIGRAHYRNGVKDADAKSQDALGEFTQAKNSFEKALNVADPELRKEAAYNHANCVAQIATQSAAAQKYDDTIKAFKESVTEYEQFIRQYPDHAAAKKNLDHMRFLLKSMMQNPPKQDPNQKNQQGKGDKKDDQKKEDKKQGGQDQNQDQQQAQQDKKDDKDKQDQAKKDAQQKQQQQAEEKQAKAEKKDKDNQQKAGEKPDDKQNTDAILQSLEDIDKREQKEAKKNEQHGNLRIKSDWW